MTVEEIRGQLRDESDKFPVDMPVLAIDDDRTCLMLLDGLLRKCQYHAVHRFFFSSCDSWFWHSSSQLSNAQGKRRAQYLLHLCLYFNRRSTLQLLTSGLLVVLLLNYFLDRNSD